MMCDIGTLTKKNTVLSADVGLVCMSVSMYMHIIWLRCSHHSYLAILFTKATLPVYRMSFPISFNYH